MVLKYLQRLCNLSGHWERPAVVSSSLNPGGEVQSYLGEKKWSQHEGEPVNTL